MKIITVIGARPQFIKASALSKLIRKQRNINEIIIHTGQHYDYEMSSIFFEELNIPQPKYNLNIKSKYHGAMTGKMMEGIEKILLKEKPDYTLVYGDTNSTLAGALASKKLNIPVIHIEAGLRSYNKKMPEEINRVLTDHCSDILFTPSKLASENLKNEGIKQNSIINVGDIMHDVFLSIYKKIKKNKIKYDILVTIHRPENTNSKSKMINIIKNLNKLSKEYNILFPVHPRTKKAMGQYKILKLLSKKIKAIRPLSYKQAIYYLKYAKLLITDSGGMQKEAFFAKTQTLTIRNETEWPETIRARYNRLVNPKKNFIYTSVNKYIGSKGNSSKPYGNGKTAKLIIKIIKNKVKKI
jgi:UDP-N-acetylglucosamine 2-epimerase